MCWGMKPPLVRADRKMSLCRRILAGFESEALSCSSLCGLKLQRRSRRTNYLSFFFNPRKSVTRVMSRGSDKLNFWFHTRHISQTDRNRNLRRWNSFGQTQREGESLFVSWETWLHRANLKQATGWFLLQSTRNKHVRFMLKEQTETFQDLLNTQLKEKLVFVKSSDTFFSFIQCLVHFSNHLQNLQRSEQISQNRKTPANNRLLLKIPISSLKYLPVNMSVAQMMSFSFTCCQCNGALCGKLWLRTF